MRKSEVIKQPRLLMVTTIATTLRAFLLPFAVHYRSMGWRVDALASGVTECIDCVEGFDKVFEAPWSRNIFSLGRNLGAASTIRNIVSSERYDLVHVHTPIASFVTRSSLRRRPGYPRVIYTAHGFHFYKGGGTARNLAFMALEKLAGYWTDAIVVINKEDEAMAHTLSIVPNEQIYYIPGIGIDLDRYNPSRVSSKALDRLRFELELGTGNTVFLQVAEFSPGKRHGDLLRAFSQLPSTTRLLLAGDGPQLQPMVQLAHDLCIADRVRFLGFRRDIPELLKAADALVLVSEREGLPRCVLEAMAMGCPVIGTAVRGIRDLIGGGVGILVQLGDVDAIAAAMRAIAESPEMLKAMCAKGRIHVSRFDLRRVIDLHDKLYERVLE